MTRQKKYPDTDTFRFYNANPKGKYTGDCAVRAIAAAVEKPWERVTMELAEMSCKTGYSFASKENMDKYLIQNGFAKEKQPRKRDNTKLTGEEFCRELQKWLGDKCIWGTCTDNGVVIAPRIVANIGGHHVVAIVDGKVNDIWDSTDGCIGNYWVYL